MTTGSESTPQLHPVCTSDAKPSRFVSPQMYLLVFVSCLLLGLPSFADPNTAISPVPGEMVIMIANFSLDGEDEFSKEVLLQLDKGLSKTGVRVQRYNNFIDNSAPDKILEAIQQDEAIQQGMIIYGFFDQNTKLADIHLHLFNMPEDKVFKTAEPGQELPSNLKKFHFFIESHAHIVTAFVTGLINYHKANYSEALKYFHTTFTLYEGSQDEFKSLCKYYIGNSYLASGDFSSASNGYHEAIMLDQEFTVAYWNLGVACRMDNNNILATVYFKKANALEPELKMPFHFETLENNNESTMLEAQEANKIPIAFFPRRAANMVYFTEPTYYEIYDVFGRLVKKGTNDRVNVEMMSAGSYFLNFDNKTEKFVRK